MAALIAERSGNRPILHAFPANPRLVWEVSLATPYSLDASKNRRWSNNGKGAVYLSAGVRSYQDMLIVLMKNAIGTLSVCQSKLWVSIFVQKPDHRSDAINVVDTICDALKKATGLDDRWFSLAGVDWEVTKKADPQIYIKFGQEGLTNEIICTHCGNMLPPERFTKNKGGPLGRSRSCIDCSRAIDAARRVGRKQLV